MTTAPTPDAVVVGSGPNGLAAAVTLAQHGLTVVVLEAHDEIGGGTRSAELTVPGVRHDVCSAIHPLGVGSPYLRSLPLADHGLVWRWPEVDLAHPLDDGTAAVLVRDLDETARGLGADGRRWRSVFGPLARSFDDVAPDVFGPVVHVPRRPVPLARFGLRAALPASVLARAFRTDAARALLAGCAAHICRPLDRPTTSAIGAALIAAGHRHGWPVAEGGSRAITDALAGLLRSLGGEIRTGVRVRSLDDLPDARVALFDTSPTGFADIARRPRPRWRYGMAAHKLDLAVRGGVPWTAEACRRAGTVHVGGTFEVIADAEARVAGGELPERPFVLVGQQYLADPSRSAGDVHPVWVYAHVPLGFAGDATSVVLEHVERYAPGLRERIVGQHVTDPVGFAAYNPNYVQGDIASGMVSVPQLVRRAPYATGVPGVYLCSSSTAPGPGVHGMCGHRAALRALADLDRVRS
ncbi:NAD(P)/FAD-dependent oxidoreductase [Nocardioides sp. YIM 152315]|uniref:phytoene desaturase family protein n=1 Tax=Nocardioides sp. YIM 152315 TaxID=3031760 RepID=UPI0023DB6ED7|nr:NAD(P)/FAD-dependent oxidoreductase [Nocardioides sp. YIM 152315]MDF1603170.1 NAD(P)/FAD-dependent oxidoreductase [Nocardioides sp. YIM 152315]